MTYTGQPMMEKNGFTVKMIYVYPCPDQRKNSVEIWDLKTRRESGECGTDHNLYPT